MLVAIVVSFICSIMEAVLLSITSSYIEALKRTRPNVANQMSELKSEIDQPLSAILTLNTVAHTAGAAGVGMQATVIFGESALGIASALMTLLVLVFSEIIPKTVGANYWRRMAPTITVMATWLVFLLKPFVLMSVRLSKLFAKKEGSNEYIRTELEAMAALAKKSGAIHKSESRIISSLLKFRNSKLESILTPRTVLFKVSKNMTASEYLKQHGSTSFSRILVYDKDPDDIVGFVHRNDVMLAFHRLGAQYRIGKLVKPLYTVPVTLQLPRLFADMIEHRTHISLAIDEYGEIKGVVTLEDLIEALIGLDILDERDQFSDMQEKAISKWQKRMREHKNLIQNNDEDDDIAYEEGVSQPSNKSSKLALADSLGGMKSDKQKLSK